MTVVEQLRDEVVAAKSTRRDNVVNWQLNVNERRGKDDGAVADSNRSMVPMDWTITKAKSAQLFSQMPQVRLLPRHAQYRDAVPVFATIVNDLLTHANVEAVMNEAVVDCVNAAGVGAAIVRYEALTEAVEVPAIDMATLSPEAHRAVMQGEVEVPMVPAERVTDRRFCVDRVSPDALLVPDGFRLSNWNKSPWLGYTGREPWARAKRLLNLDDAVKDDVVGAGGTSDASERLTNMDRTPSKAEDIVEFDEVFYWRHIYHADEKYYDAIQRVVFVKGMDEPAIDEPWVGQRFDEENGGYVGACLLPIRVLTLVYISDEAIPPSDSAVIRPLIKELQESRRDFREQRKHSRPLQWFDVDKIDPSMTGDLIGGTWAGMVPTIGDGSRVIGEVSRASYPRENHEFDAIFKRDIQEAVSVGPNQSGQYASGERSASEAQIVQQSFQTEIGQQRARVASFLVGIAEVLAGLFVLYGEVEETGIGASIGPEGVERLKQWDRDRINQKFVFDVRVDSTVRLDAQQLLQQLTSVLNVTAQSGFINPEMLIRRIIELNGIDPNEVMVKPQPKGPEPPKISYAFKGEDLYNPAAMALVLDAGLTPEKMAAAKKAIAEMMSAMPLPGMPSRDDLSGPPPGVVMPPGGADVSGMPGAAPAMPPTNPQVPEKAFPQWESSPRINTRRSEG